MRRLLVLALLCIGTSVLAQSPSAPAITGRVLAAGSELPLRRARIDVSAKTWKAEPVLTDDAGRFSVVAGGSGPLTLTVTKGGYLSATMTIRRENLDRPLELHVPRGAVISGIVLDLTGVPAQGYSVSVKRVNGDPERDGSPVQFSGVTDDLGEYRVGGLAPGTYEVAAGSALRVPEQIAVLVRDVGLGDKVQVRVDGAEERSGVQLTAPAITGLDAVTAAMREQGLLPPETTAKPALRPGIAASVRGRVLTAVRTPVSGATVSVIGSGTNRSARTNPDGAYIVSGLPAGRYTVETTVNGLLTWRHGQDRVGQAGRPIIISTDQPVEGIDIVFPPLRVIRGLVMDEHGEPVQGARVQAMQVQWEGDRLVAAAVGAERRTDDRGSYRLWGLYDGTYLVRASVDGVLAGRADRDNTYPTLFYPGSPTVGNAQRIDLREEAVANIAFNPLTLTEVTGVALDGTDRLVAGTVRLLEARQQGLVSTPRTGTIQPDGTFIVRHVPTGNYILQVVGDGPGRTGLFGTLPVSVGEAPVRVTLRASYGTAVEGRVVIESGDSKGFQVTPVPLDERARIEPRLVMIGATEFFVTGLFGPTAFSLRGGGSTGTMDDWFLKAFTINGTDISDTGFDFGSQPNTITDAVLVLSRNGASISGRLRTSTSRDYSVVVFPGARDWRFAASRRVKFVRAAADGTFRISGLPPGDYFVAAVDRLDGGSNGGEWQNPELMLRLESGAERITLAEGQSRSVSLGLIER